MHYFLSPSLSLILAKLIVKSAMVYYFRMQNNWHNAREWKANSFRFYTSSTRGKFILSISKRNKVSLVSGWREGIKKLAILWLKVDGCCCCARREIKEREYIYRSLKTLRAVGETQFDNQFISGELIVQRVAFNVSLVTLSRCANAGTAFPVMNDGNEGWGRGY